MKLIAVGDNVCDCYLNEKVFYPGGNCINVAVNTSRNGIEVGYIGIFGDDDKAEHIQNCLKLENVCFSKSRYVHAPSGQPGVNITDEGDREFVKLVEDTAQTLFKLQLTRSDLKYIETFDILHTSVYSSLDEELYKLKGIINISYDYSDIDIHSLERVRKTAPYVKYAFMSGSKLDNRDKDRLVQEFFACGTELVCITNGKEDVEVYHVGSHFTMKPLNAIVKDTMGAGDSFIAGVLTKILYKSNIKDAIYFGLQKAKETCEIEGGIGYAHPMT